MMRANLFTKIGAVGTSAVLMVLCGCHSSYMQATIRNASGGPVTLVEVDYPSASFGTGSLVDGATFDYRFKILGSGGTKVLWTDALHKEHTVAGPELHEGEEGRLTVTLTSTGQANWDSQVHRR